MTRTVARSRRAVLLAVTAIAAAGLAACGSSDAGGTSGGAAAPNSGSTVRIVGYSVPKPAYDALEAAFVKTRAGKGVKFSESFGASGTQSKAVAAGQPADYVAFSVEPDMTRLVPKFVDPSWNATPTDGMVADSVVVFVVRKGNPKHIESWSDLIKPGIKIVTPDPASSGSAKWNILAAYAQVLSQGGTQAQAKAYLKAFFKNVVAKPASGADATTTFLSGTGDVLISYEDQAIDARQAGDDVDYVVPKQSFLIQLPAAVTKTAPPAAKAFLHFALSAAGQKIFASKGFRPVDASVSPGVVPGAIDPSNPFPKVDQLYTIAMLGGWDAVNSKFFDPKTGIIFTIENATSG